MMKIENEKCRLCLSEHESSDLTPIFPESETPGLSLAAQIMICLSLPVQEKDALPDGVCDVCKSRVKEFYAFRETSLITYYSLLRHGNFHHNDEDYGGAYVETSIDHTVAVYEKETQAEPQEMEVGLQQDIAPVAVPSPKIYTHGKEYSGLDNSHFDEKSLRLSSQDDTFAEEISTSAYAEGLAYNCAETNIQQKSEKSDEETKSNVLNTEIIRYKCIHCEYLFSDLDTASIHSAECSRVNESVFGQHTTNTDYPNVNLREIAKNHENTKETNFQRMIPSETGRTTTDQNEQRSCTPIGKRRSSQITEKSKARRKRKTRDCKRLHPCEDCKSVFSSAALLRRHSFVHTGLRPYECPLCNKRFCQIGQLNFHKNFHINPRYRCNICQKPFLRPSDIEKHMRTHTGEKPYSCAICKKSFAQLVSLQQHERVHTGDKPFICEICGKKFSQKANKTKHVKIHKEGEKPHTCDICGRSFSDLEEMKLHRAGHGGGKPRKCNYCDESFRKTSELSQHERRCHTFEKPHKCAFCHKAFYSLYNLKQHVMVHTGQKPYACSHCDLKFTQKGNLTKHIERKHSDITSSTDNPVVIEIENNDNDEEILTLANNFLNNTTSPLIIEREEVVEI